MIFHQEGLLTPCSALGVSGAGESWRAAGRFRIGERLAVSLEGERKESAGESPVHGVALRGSMRW